jgi:hypothetical protein
MVGIVLHGQIMYMSAYKQYPLPGISLDIHTTIPFNFSARSGIHELYIWQANLFDIQSQRLKSPNFKETFSNYKSYNTAKYMVGIVLHGQIMYMSAYKQYPLPGRVEMVDRGSQQHAIVKYIFYVSFYLHLLLSTSQIDTRCTSNNDGLAWMSSLTWQWEYFLRWTIHACAGIFSTELITILCLLLHNYFI